MFGAEINEMIAGIGGIAAALFFLVMFVLGVMMPLVIYLIYSNMYRSRQLLESIDQKLERLVNLATDRQPPASGAAGRDMKR
jgi:type IV secretory pathway VirB3-like protein